MKLVSLVSTKFDCVEKPGILKAPCRKDWSSIGKLEARECNRDAASSPQGWLKDAVSDVRTRRLVGTEEDQEHLNFREDSTSTRKLVASGNSEIEGKDEIWAHNLHFLNRLRTVHGEGFLYCETKTWSQSER